WKKYNEAADTQTTIEFEEFYAPFNKWFHIRVYPSQVGLASYIQDITEGVVAQQEERVTRMQARLIELAHDSLIVRDPASVIISWNRGAEELYGWTAQEAVGKVSHALLQTQFPQSREALDAFLATGEQWQGELVHTRRDGVQVTVESHQVLLRNEEGHPIVILEINRDITGLKQQERQIEVDQLRLAAIVESSDDGIASKTLDGIITSWNLAAERIFGYTAQEAIGQHIYLIIPPELRPEEDTIISKLRKGERIDHFETVRRRKDGTRIDVSLTISPIKNKAGQIIGASKIARDITEQKRLQRHLQSLYKEVQQSRDQLDIILQGVADGIVVYNKEGHIIYANEAAAQMTDSPSIQSMLETPAGTISSRYEIIDEQRQPVPPSHLTHRRVLAGEQEAQAIVGYRNLTTGQPERWSLLKSRPVFDEHGEIAMVVTIIHDVTEQIVAEQRKDEFISMTSHELKTPVTSLKGFTHVLQRRLTKQGDEQALHYLSRMDAQLNKLTKLIGDLLDISRMQTGKLALDMETFDLDALVQETVENVQATTDTHQLSIEGQTKGRVLGDRDRLGQVFINLLTNAVKYSPDAHKVVVRLSQDHAQAMISVQDFGIGIDPVHQKKIFERFYQVTDPEEQTYPGLGIGLYISREIADRHDGRIEIHSRKGEGSTFTVILPLLSEDNQQSK
ncbi:MAG: PAS domain S-box protein, partial [Planctomycetes bacterium]|nr:PAS domain S-box protein [Planctomycetota bacterium]